MGERLGDQNPALHAARQGENLAVLAVPQRQRLQDLADVIRIGALAPQPTAEAHRRPHRLEGVGGQFLGHEADQRSRRPIVADDVVPIDRHAPLGRVDDAADDADQRRLAGAVRPQQRKDLAAANVEIDALERLEPGRIGFGQVRNGDDGLHEGTAATARTLGEITFRGESHICLSRSKDQPCRGRHRSRRAALSAPGPTMNGAPPGENWAFENRPQVE